MTAAKPKFPAFDRYTCLGDSRSVDVGPFTITARIEHDYETSPRDFDCYSGDDIAAWDRDEWHFAGIVLSVACAGATLNDHAASLWGVNCNFPGSDNAYLSECADDLLSEALEQGRGTLTRMLVAAREAGIA